MTADHLEQLAEIFPTEGIITTSDLNDYFDVVKRSLDVHLDREKIRRGLWKQYSAAEQARQIKIKADRIMHSLELLETTSDGEALVRATVEELFDVNNYANFTVRKLERTA